MFFYFEDWDSGLTFSGISMKEPCSPPSRISTLGLPVSGIRPKVSLSAPVSDTRNFHPRRISAEMGFNPKVSSAISPGMSGMASFRLKEWYGTNCLYGGMYVETLR